MTLRQRFNGTLHRFSTANGILHKIISFAIVDFSPFQIFILICQLITLFTVTILSPFLIRHVCLPSQIQLKSPLDFTFETCHENLAGVCSYPTATVSLNENNWELNEDQWYDIRIEVILSDVISSQNLGQFQVLFEAYDANRQRIVSLRRTARVIDARSYLDSVKYLMFWPFYFMGIWHNIARPMVSVELNDKFLQFSNRATDYVAVQLQNRLAEIDAGTVVISAHLGLFRRFLFEWPVLSTLLIGLLAYSWCFVSIVFYWLCRSLFVYLKYNGTSSNNERDDNYNSNRNQVNVERQGNNISLSASESSPTCLSMLSHLNTASDELHAMKTSDPIHSKDTDSSNKNERKISHSMPKLKRFSTDKKNRVGSKYSVEPKQLANLLESFIEKSHSTDVNEDVIRTIQSLVNRTIGTTSAAIHLRKLVNINDCLNLSAVLQKSLPALIEAMKRYEVSINGIKLEEESKPDESDSVKQLLPSTTTSVTSKLFKNSTKDSPKFEVKGEVKDVVNNEKGKLPDTSDTIADNNNIDDINEEPECVQFSDIPGWTVEPVEPPTSLRKRIVHNPSKTDSL